MFSQIKMWITHNEPWVLAYRSYEDGVRAPFVINKGYKAGYNLIRSHGRVYELYKNNYKEAQNG